MRRQKPTGRKVIVEGKLLLEELSRMRERKRERGLSRAGRTEQRGLYAGVGEYEHMYRDSVRERVREGRGRKRESELKDESISRVTVAPKPNRTLCHV